MIKKIKLNSQYGRIGGNYGPVNPAAARPRTQGKDIDVIQWEKWKEKFAFLPVPLSEIVMLPEDEPMVKVERITWIWWKPYYKRVGYSFMSRGKHIETAKDLFELLKYDHETKL